MMPIRKNDARFLAVRRVKRRNAPRLWARRGVTGVAVGYKLVGGRRTKRLAIRVFVEKKLERELLSPGELLPERLEGVEVDVIEAVFALQNGSDIRRERHDPLVGGISVGHVDITAGTLGVSTFDNESGKDMILSNWHVLDGETGEIEVQGSSNPDRTTTATTTTSPPTCTAR